MSLSAKRFYEAGRTRSGRKFADCARVMYAELKMRVPAGCRPESGKKRARERGTARWVAACVTVAILGCPLPLQAKGPKGAEKKPWLQLPLQSLGFPGISNTFLASGSSVLTVHFLDNSHLLVTYGLRKLVPRLEKDPEDHDDRLVAAEIVDLPSGHVGAHTEWHMHDHGRYLWSLGGGRFLVRIGEQLYTFAPLASADEKDAFRRVLFPSRPRRPNLVVVSPDGGVVTTETVFTQAEQRKSNVVLGDEDTAPVAESKTVIEFYRLQNAADGGLDAEPAGGVQSPVPIFLPIDADGYLWAEDSGAGSWSVTFDGFGGKTIQLGKIASSCRPRLQMTSRSEYIALTCQGSDERIKMTSYGLDGQETWEELVGDFGRPSFAFAPKAGRFAVSATSSDGPPPDTGAAGSGVGPRQEVRVYQNVSGDLLLRLDLTPAFKTAENFDLSADGMMAAVVRNGAIAVYKLPELSKRDHDDMAEVAALAPPVSTGNVTLARITAAKNVKAMQRASVDANGVRPSLGPPPETSEMVRSNGLAPRKPPTLLNPGEKPEFGKGNAEPN
jgi:hypothetical protein